MRPNSVESGPAQGRVGYDVCVRFHDADRRGPITCSRILAEVVAELGLEALASSGPANSATVRVASNPIRGLGDGVDTVVAMSSAVPADALEGLRPGGRVIYTTGGVGVAPAEHGVAEVLRNDVHRFSVPFQRLAHLATGSNQHHDLAAAGAVAYFHGLPPEACLARIAARPRRREAPAAAFRQGYEYARDHFPRDQAAAPSGDGAPRSIVTGLEATLRGAVDWGLKHFVLCPGTPIPGGVLEEVREAGVHVAMAEDDTAAAARVVGAAFAGQRAMLVTSGLGLAAMSDLIAVAARGEIGALIVDVQAGTDLGAAIYGGGGDCPHIVIAPTGVSSCYAGIQRALDLAEQRQSPVLVLLDHELADRAATEPFERRVDTARCTRVKGAKAGAGVPGDKGALRTASGRADWHSLGFEPGSAKLRAKHDALQAELPPAQVFGDQDAEIGLAVWGSVLGTALDGMDLARAEGVKSKLVASVMVDPQHEDSFREAFDSCERVLVPEVGFEGPYAALLRERYGVKAVSIPLDAGPASPEAIARCLVDVHHELA